MDELRQAIKSTVVIVALDNKQWRTESYREARDFFSEPTRIHIVRGIFSREDSLILTECEQLLYLPGTKLNTLYECRTMRWQQISWMIASIPASDEKRAQDFFTARQHTLEPGTFVAQTDNGPVRFPFRGMNFRLLCALPPKNTPMH